jgi:hypothetical protein
MRHDAPACARTHWTRFGPRVDALIGELVVEHPEARDAELESRTQIFGGRIEDGLDRRDVGQRADAQHVGRAEA